jgi:four helix bundle protein
MTYEEWERTVPAALRADAIWRVQAFRLASYLGAAAGSDADRVADQPWLVKSAAQLASAAESISANIAEGYARLSPKDRIRYYEYALGSAGETKSRYLSLSRRFDPPLLDARLAILQSVTRLVLKMIRSGRLLSSPDDSPSQDPPSPEPAIERARHASTPTCRRTLHHPRPATPL